MKSWKNKRNTYWILIATVFGVVFSGNQINNYKNLTGLIFCWMLYLFYFFYNNQEVKKQEKQEKEEQQKRVKLELVKKEKEKAKKEKKNKEFYELVEYPKIISYIMDKYNKDWENDLYPKNARYHIDDIKRQIQSKIEFEEREINNYKNAIKKIENFKNKTKLQNEQRELNDKIIFYQAIINNCKEHIKIIPQKYNTQIAFYQDTIERYKDKCRKHEQKANELLQNSPEKIIEAIDYHLHKIEEIKHRPLKDCYDDRDIWLKREEEKIPYLLQAKLNAIDRIKEMEK